MVDQKSIIIGTRGSELALWQARFLQDQLAKLGVQSEFKIINTKGDEIQHLSFDKIEGKGFFTKEIEDALLSHEVDIAVHSMKDMTTTPTPGLVLAAVSYREDHRDCLLIHPNSIDSSKPLQLKSCANVGTSSSRRKAQINALRDDLVCRDLRGNVPTRVRKLAEHQYDAILLASAGLNRLRLDLSPFIVMHLHHREFVPAPAQGVLAYQCREQDVEMRMLLHKIHHEEVADCTNVERTVLRLMGGGCHMPLGVYCEKDANGFFHAYASWGESLDQPLKKTNVSQSTTFGMAETIFQNLKV